jgi:hypothetical protein
MLCRERGEFRLTDQAEDNYFVACQNFLLDGREGVEATLDIIELSFKYIDTVIRSLPWPGPCTYGVTQKPDDAIGELNSRFKEHCVGYQFMGSEIVRIDSQFIHAEVVQNALSLLQDSGFHGANEEFLKAHEHYRHGRTKEAIADALKSLESTMRCICHERRMTVQAHATAKPLIDALCAGGLIPDYLAGQFGGLRAALEGGLLPLSNRTSRHGQGQVPQDVPSYMAAYALHLAAANIVMLVAAHRAK